MIFKLVTVYKDMFQLAYYFSCSFLVQAFFKIVNLQDKFSVSKSVN